MRCWHKKEERSLKVVLFQQRNLIAKWGICKWASICGRCNLDPLTQAGQGGIKGKSPDQHFFTVLYQRAGLEEKQASSHLGNYVSCRLALETKSGVGYSPFVNIVTFPGGLSSSSVEKEGQRCKVCSWKSSSSRHWKDYSDVPQSYLLEHWMAGRTLNSPHTTQSSGLCNVPWGCSPWPGKLDCSAEIPALQPADEQLAVRVAGVCLPPCRYSSESTLEWAVSTLLFLSPSITPVSLSLLWSCFHSQSQRTLQNNTWQPLSAWPSFLWSAPSHH